MGDHRDAGIINCAGGGAGKLRTRIIDHDDAGDLRANATDDLGKMRGDFECGDDNRNVG
jgi:hypothetical protein